MMMFIFNRLRLTVYVNFYSRRYYNPGKGDGVWQYMLISTLVDGTKFEGYLNVWQYMLISTLVDEPPLLFLMLSDSIC